MAMVSGRRSTLNPDAPLFVPAAVRQVEDFSPEWWQLVTTSTWYHDYWISQHQGADGFYDGEVDVADLLPESFDFDDMEDLFEADEFGGEIYHTPSDFGKALSINNNLLNQQGLETNSLCDDQV